nr:DUF4198 domain-containing protein [uncultured Desulfobacter sp.]
MGSKTQRRGCGCPKNIKGMLYRAAAVSYFTVGKWQAPHSLGYDLKIIPLTDLSNIRVGDLVKFKVLFMGKNLNRSSEISIEYIMAVSDSFGGSDGFTLSCHIFSRRSNVNHVPNKTVDMTWM